MQTHFSAEDLAFRDEVRAFFSDNFTADLGERIGDMETYRDAIIEWQKILHQKGWIAPNWPVEHGGTGWSDTQKFIYENTRASMGVPDVNPFGLKMVSPIANVSSTWSEPTPVKKWSTVAR